MTSEQALCLEVKSKSVNYQTGPSAIGERSITSACAVVVGVPSFRHATTPRYDNLGCVASGRLSGRPRRKHELRLAGSPFTGNFCFRHSGFSSRISLFVMRGARTSSSRARVRSRSSMDAAQSHRRTRVGREVRNHFASFLIVV